MGLRKYCKVRTSGREMKAQKCVMAKDRKEAEQKMKDTKGKILVFSK